MENKLNSVLIVIIAFLSMAVAFIVIYLVIAGGPSKSTGTPEGEKANTQVEKKAEVDYKKAVNYQISEMDPINLKSGGKSNKSIVKLKVTVQLYDKKFEEEFKKREAQVKDIIITTFWNKTGDDLEDGNAIKVKEELINKLRAMYKEPKESNKILDIFFDSFILQ